MTAFVHLGPFLVYDTALLPTLHYNDFVARDIVFAAVVIVVVVRRVDSESEFLCG